MAAIDNNLMIYAVDVGSEAKGNLAWCRLPALIENPDACGESLETLADQIAADLTAGRTVALGFECPLVLDLRADPKTLTKARDNEGNRPWCAGAGASALAVGLVQCAWVFERLAQANQRIVPTFAWADLVAQRANLLIWEAFISNKKEQRTHCEDAKIAAKGFKKALRDDDQEPPSALNFSAPYSLAGAALLRAGLSSDTNLLSQPCIVVRVKSS